VRFSQLDGVKITWEYYEEEEGLVVNFGWKIRERVDFTWK